MKVLILSAATGGGHLRASHAVEEYITANSKNTEVKVVDTLKSISPVLDKTICDGYHFLATKTPKVFGKLYQKTNEENSFSQFVPKFNSLFSQKLMPLFNEYQPDVIIATHPFVNEMVSKLKGKGIIQQPLICIMTDYGPHRAWIADNVDAYIVSSEDMISDMTELGVKKEKVYPFGIPVHDVFFNKADKVALLKELDLNPDLPTVLIMAGSFGVSNVMQVYKDIVKLPSQFQLILITGKNQKLYDAFEKEIKNSPKLTKLVFFTNEVEKYMHASDLLVTKPGGLTVSEALACSIPLAVFDAIPGQEEDNANFLVAHEMGVRIQEGDNCAQIIEDLLADRKRLEKMRDSCEQFDKSQASKNILSLIEELVQKKAQ